MSLFEQLTAALRRDEGTVLHAYQDSRGFWTIGTGRLIDKLEGGGITQEESDYLLSHDIVRAKQRVDRELPWAADLDEPRYGALLNMSFNMGGNLFQFKKALAFLKIKDFTRAAAEFKNSSWYRQVGARAERLCEQIRSGAWQ